MCQMIQRLLFLSVAMNMLFFVCEPMVPLMQSALAAGRLMSEMPALTPLAAPQPIPIPSPSLPKPVIRVSSPSFSFSARRGDGSSTTQTFTVTNIGQGTLNWNATATAAWLTLGPASGKDTGTITLTATAGSLPIGIYNATITLSAAGATAVTIPVNLTIEAAPVPPIIGTSPATLSFTAVQGDSNSSSQTVSISNTGGGLLNWLASENASWLSISPSSGTGNGSVTVTATPGPLTAGIYNTLVTINATNAQPVSILISLTVTAPSTTVVLSPSSLTFSGVQGGANPAGQTVVVNSNGNWTASSSATWLTLSPASGNGNGSIAANVALSSAVVGTNNATITVTSGGVTRTISVALTVSAASLTASPNNVTYIATQGAGNPSAQAITIGSNGAWTVTDNASWLSISATSGTGNGSITAAAITGSLTAGTYNALITVSSTSATPVSIPVTFTVTAPSSTITVSPTSLTLTGIQGGTNPASQAVTVNSSGKWTASSSATWLTLSPASGNGNGSVAANVALSSAVVGTNNATITVMSGGVTRTISVALTVSAASLTASPNSVTYKATQGAANPSAQTITINSNGPWSASDGASWLSLSPTSGSKNGTITASVNTANATQGNNATTITVKSGGITRTVNVALTMNASSSSSVTLTWNANTERDLAGYRVYRATSSGTYGAPIATIQGNMPNYIATGLQFGTTYFFVVTAFDIAGNESAYSNEVSKSIF
ncbi:MAG: fibronectin type III domain-containing protein [Nitrospira sp.]|nr:fibronectin type III domain-containing protein [Nitrospira sp.]